MIHFSCDRCRRALSEEEVRYTVSIEVQVALEPPHSQVVEGTDLHEILMHFDDEEEREELSQFAYQRRQFDMCADCQREYLKNPLAIDTAARVDFSQN